jgi:uncharacterized protein YacL
MDRETLLFTAIGLLILVVGVDLGIKVLSELAKILSGRERSPGTDTVIFSLLISWFAIILAAAALEELLKDSKVLQEQLAELKKITAILESKN